MTVASATEHGHPVAVRARFAVMLVSANLVRRTALARRMRTYGARTVIEAGDPTQARRSGLIEGSRDLCIIDGTALDGPVVSLVRDLRAMGWRRIAVLTHRHDAYAVRMALAAGIRAFVVANDMSTTATYRNVIPMQRQQNHIPSEGLSSREIEVIQAVAEGQSNKEIGVELGLSALTVKSHLARIARKLGTGDRAGMVSMTMRSGLIR